MRRTILCSVGVFVALALLGCAMMDAGGGGSLPQVSAADMQKRQQTVAGSDMLIVPGQRVGPVSVGMGMDEVFAALGHPDFIDGGDRFQGPEWQYLSINLDIRFEHGTAAPAVQSVATKWWTDVPIKAAYKTREGLRVGSSFFDVKRSYGTSDDGSDIGYDDGHHVMGYRQGISFSSYAGGTSNQVSYISVYRR